MINKYVSPEELRRLLSSLFIFMGVLLLFGVFAFIVVPGLRNANRPEAGPPVSAPQGETGWLQVTEYPPAKGYAVPPVDPKPLMAASPQSLARGKALFAADCAVCHGDAGRGDGLAGKGLVPPPRDFTSPQGWVNGHQLPGIYKTLSEGVKGSSMAAFTVLLPRDRMALAHYVQSLGSFPHNEDPKGLEALSKQLGSEGQVIPARIPVSWATADLVKEATPVQTLPLPPHPATPEAELLRRVVADPVRAARTLAGAPGWREDLTAFERAVTTGVPGNGFRVSAAGLNPSEFKELQRFLGRLSPGGELRPVKLHWKGEESPRVEK
jgi:mono/diheme cytochrome c family protein